jgi:tetratricopeptide (TPR) repeat protein
MSNYYCANCGISATATAKFCRQCGAKLAAQSAGLPAIESVSPEGAAAAMVAISEPTAPLTQASQQGRLAPRSPESSTALAEQKRATLTKRMAQALEKARARFSKMTVGSSAEQQVATNNQGAARALARASGLTAQHPFGSALRVAGIALALLLAGSAYLALRDQNPTKLHANRSANLIAPDERSRQFVLLGKHDRDQGHYDAAIDDFKQAIALIPSNIEAHFLLAKSYKAVGRIDDALQTFAKLLEIDSKNLAARYEMAEIYRERGDWRAAITEYRRIIEIDHSSEQGLAALEVIEAYEAERAANLAPLRRPPRNETQLQPFVPWLPAPSYGSHLHLSLPELTHSAISRQPVPGTSTNTDDSTDARALADYSKKNAERFFNIREYNAAIREAQTALNFTPNDTDLYYIIGSAYFGNKQFALAHENFKKCLSSTYATQCHNQMKESEKQARQEAKKAEAKKKESSGGVGKSIKNFFK